MSTKTVINTQPLTFEQAVKLKALDMASNCFPATSSMNLLKLLELNSCFSKDSILFKNTDNNTTTDSNIKN